MISIEYWSDAWPIRTYTVKGAMPQRGETKDGSWVCEVIDRHGRMQWWCLQCQSIACECVQAVRRADVVRRLTDNKEA